MIDEANISQGGCARIHTQPLCLTNMCSKQSSLLSLELHLTSTGVATMSLLLLAGDTYLASEGKADGRSLSRSHTRRMESRFCLHTWTTM